MHEEMTQTAATDDKSNFALSLFWSLCEIVCDCFDDWYFLQELGFLRKIPWSKTFRRQSDDLIQ